MKIARVCDIEHSKLAKLLIYGGPGSGKTPLCGSVPDTLMCITEPGTKSIRHLETHVVECFTRAALNEFFGWLRSDTKEKNEYFNICIDSISELAAIHVKELEAVPTKAGNQADGKKVYGDMARAVARELDFLYKSKQFNVLLIAKRGEVEFENMIKFRPYFPGKSLSILVPHMFDGMFHLDRTLGKWDNSQGTPTLVNDLPGKYVPAIFTRETNTFTARDRSGLLNEVEYPDMSYILSKINY